jgi:hypothetical protein
MSLFGHRSRPRAYHEILPPCLKDPKARSAADVGPDQFSGPHVPAMACGLEQRLWDIGDIVKLIEDWEANDEA